MSTLHYWLLAGISVAATIAVAAVVYYISRRWWIAALVATPMVPWAAFAVWCAIGNT